MNSQRNQLSYVYLTHQVDRGLIQRVNLALKIEHDASFSLLTVLAAINLLQTPSPSDLSSYLNQSRPSVARPIKLLVSRGYVTQHTYVIRPEWSILNITDSGEKTMARWSLTASDTLRPLLGTDSVVSQIERLNQINKRLRRYIFPADLL